MPIRSPRAWLPLLIGALVPGALALTAGDDENWIRLRLMPREQRSILAEKLNAFDALSREEREALRKLDQKIAGLSAPDQALARSVLRRYHLWVESLSDAQKSELSNAPTDRRMTVVAKILSQEATGGPPPSHMIQIVDLGGVSPFLMAHMCKLWLKLSPAQQAEIAKLPLGPPRQERLKHYAGELKIGAEHRPAEPQVEATLARLKSQFKSRGWPLPRFLEKDIEADASVKSGDDKEARAKHNEHVEARRRVAENYAFLENPPKGVDPARLLRFEATVPPTLRASFDHLPPEEVRRRLTILYRLIYPHPGEMPDVQSTTKPKASKPIGPAGPKSPASPSPATTF